MEELWVWEITLKVQELKEFVQCDDSVAVGVVERVVEIEEEIRILFQIK